MNQNDIDLILKSGDPRAIKLLYDTLNIPLATFVPRPNNYTYEPENPDEQASFYNDQFQGIACILGGNFSGKTMVSAAKVARFLLNTPPPRKNTPYWVVSQTESMATGTCWAKWLAQFIPESMIQDYTWSSMAAGLPDRVILKKHANNNNFMIEIKSAEQDRKRFQAASIAGWWIDELIPYSILVEIHARTRDYTYPGSCIYSLTPLEPSPELEGIFYHQEDYPQWRIYRLNSDLNHYVSAEFRESFLAMELEERRETRRTGVFCSFEGVVYKSFNPKIHVIDEQPIPTNWNKLNGLDFGFAHATCHLWAAKDLQGRYFIYDEYFAKQGLIKDHIEAIRRRPVQGPIYSDYEAAQERCEFAAQGLPTSPARKDVLLGIAAVQQALKVASDGRPGLFITKNCVNLIREMRVYSWHTTLDKPKKVDDHACDALRYLIYSDAQHMGVPSAMRVTPPPRRIG